MITVIIKRSDEPNVVQLTQELIMQELSVLNSSEMLLEDSWAAGLKKVRTPFVCLVEPDCLLSVGFLPANLNIFHKNTKGQEGRGKGGGGYTKLAMMASCVCVNSYKDRTYGLNLLDNTLERRQASTAPYHVQAALIPGAIIRLSSIKDVLDTLDWDDPNLLRLSAELSVYLWGSGRRLKVNPLTDYVSTNRTLNQPDSFDVTIPQSVTTLFERDFDILNNPKVR